MHWKIRAGLALALAGLPACFSTLSYSTRTPPLPLCSACTAQNGRVESALRRLGYDAGEPRRVRLASEQVDGVRTNGPVQEWIGVFMHYAGCEFSDPECRRANHLEAVVTVWATTGSGSSRKTIAATEQQRRDADLLMRQVSEIFTQ